MSIEYVLFEVEGIPVLHCFGSYVINNSRSGLPDRDSPFFGNDLLTLALLYAKKIPKRNQEEMATPVFTEGDSVSTIPNIRYFSRCKKYVPVEEEILLEFRNVLEANTQIRL
mgnify:CR=1 FL=1